MPKNKSSPQNILPMKYHILTCVRAAGISVAIMKDNLKNYPLVVWDKRRSHVPDSQLEGATDLPHSLATQICSLLFNIPKATQILFKHPNFPRSSIGLSFTSPERSLLEASQNQSRPGSNTILLHLSK